MGDRETPQGQHSIDWHNNKFGVNKYKQLRMVHRAFISLHIFPLSLSRQRLTSSVPRFLEWYIYNALPSFLTVPPTASWSQIITVLLQPSTPHLSRRASSPHNV